MLLTRFHTAAFGSPHIFPPFAEVRSFENLPGILNFISFYFKSTFSHILKNLSSDSAAREKAATKFKTDFWAASRNVFLSSKTRGCDPVWNEFVVKDNRKYVCARQCQSIRLTWECFNYLSLVWKLFSSCLVSLDLFLCGAIATHYNQ